MFDLSSMSCNLFVPISETLTYKLLVPGMIKYSKSWIPFSKMGADQNRVMINLCIEVKQQPNNVIDVTWISGLTGKIWGETKMLGERIIPNGIYSE